MTNLTSRADLKSYVLRKLGSPVIEINIADEQLEDCITDALQFMNEYHVDAIEHRYIAQQVTTQDITNKYITVPAGVSGINQVLKPNDTAFGAGVGENLFDIRYHFYRNEIFDLTKSGAGMSAYYITENYISQLNDIVNFDLRYRFSKVTNRLHVDTNWETTFREGNFIVYECYEEIDPEIYPELYNHWVLKELTAAYAKKQWGTNLTKFTQVQLPGGNMLNGELILNEGKEELERVKNDFIMRFQEPSGIYYG